jgi:hypothetical protein
MRKYVIIATVCVILITAVGLAVRTTNSLPSKARNIFASLQAGDCERATKDFSAVLKAKMPAQQFGKDWSQMVTEEGSFKELIITDEFKGSSARAYVRFTLRFERGVKYGAVALDRSGKIDMFALCGRSEVIDDIVRH